MISDNSTTTTKCSASGASEDEAKAAAFCHQSVVQFPITFYFYNTLLIVALFLLIIFDLFLKRYYILTTLVVHISLVRPNYNEANNTFSEYGCGVCPDAAENGTCLSCAAWNGTTSADNSNCNSYHPPIFTYSCYQAGSSVKCSNGSLLQDIHCWG